jgi:hypothetical protein
MSEFERIISMRACADYNNFDHENGMELDDMEADYIPGYDDGEWDPVMGDIDDYPETDDEWLDDFQGEEDWA